MIVSKHFLMLDIADSPLVFREVFQSNSRLELPKHAVAPDAWTECDLLATNQDMESAHQPEICRPESPRDLRRL